MSSIDIAVLDYPTMNSKDIYVSQGNCGSADINVYNSPTMFTKDIALLSSITMSSIDVALLDYVTMSSIDLAISNSSSSQYHFCFPSNFHVEKKHIAAIYAVFYHEKD